MFAWVLGVIRTLNVLMLVKTGRLIPVKDTTSDAGLVTEPYVVDPLLLVISTRLSPAEVPAASVTVAAVIVSLTLPTSVKASTLVTVAVFRKTTRLEKSASPGLVQLTVTWVEAPAALAPVTLAGDWLSMVTVALVASVPG